MLDSCLLAKCLHYQFVLIEVHCIFDCICTVGGPALIALITLTRCNQDFLGNPGIFLSIILAIPRLYLKVG